MILIKRFLFILFAILVCGPLIAAGFYGYSLLDNAGGYTAEELKYYSEQFLFFSLVLAGALFLLFIGVFIKAIRLDRQLDKIIELNKYQDFSPKQSFENMGPLGEKLTTLYYQLNTLNERKTLKISALTALNTFLVTNSELPLLITDVGGTVIQVSTVMTEKLDKSKSEIINAHVNALFEDISIYTIVSELNKQRTSLEKQSGKHTLTCYPIHNRHNQLSYVVFILEKKAIHPGFEKKKEEQPASRQDSKVQQAFHRFLGKKQEG